MYLCHSKLEFGHGLGFGACLPAGREIGALSIIDIPLTGRDNNSAE